ncbi:MAG: DNA translocase FtsK [Oscillospiraceae bacterium]|nr:DNA translocase FtsK [Oscillospiraceae bacterium]
MAAKKAATAKKTAKPKKPTKEELARQQEQQRLQAEQAVKRRHFYWGLGLGFAVLLLGLLAVIPGENVWNIMHSGLWDFFGITLVLWLGFAVFCCATWFRNRNLRDDIPALVFLPLGMQAVGVFWALISPNEGGGWLGRTIAEGMSNAMGSFIAALLTMLVITICVFLGIVQLRELIFSRVMDRRSIDIDPNEDDEEELTLTEEKQPRGKKAAQPTPISLPPPINPILDSRNVAPVNNPNAIPTVLNFGAPAPAAPPAPPPLPPLPIDEPPRKKVKLTEDEAAQVAEFEAQVEDAAETATEGDTPAYKHPPIGALTLPRNPAGTQPDQNEENIISQRLVHTLGSFGVQVELVGRSRGPSVTRYELRPAEGVKINKITSLADDIALHLAATKVRIEAPIPGKPAVGVEVPNRVRATVSLREIIDSQVYRAGTKKSKLTVALGKDIVGDLIVADLARLPHLLIAGTTGSGKSVCMNTLIMSLMYNASPDDVKMLMIDPKQVEFNIYSGIPHLLVPVVSDPLKAAGALGWAVNEMEHRYSRISDQNVRDVDSYNNIAAMQDDLAHMPRVVIFIDELSDLMMVAPSDVEDAIQRIAQKGRAAGMHLVVATQRPSVDVITGVIKSNLPGRIALSVASQIDSRTIINTMGAEQLLGNGDMLFSPNGGNNAVRVQGCFVSDGEVQKVVNFVKQQLEGGTDYNDAVWEEIERNAANAGRGKKKGGMLDASSDSDGDEDPMFDAAAEVVINAGMASTTMLQKKLKLGYARASRLVDMLEERGIVGQPEGSKPRKVLISPAQWQEYQAQGGQTSNNPEAGE